MLLLQILPVVAYAGVASAIVGLARSAEPGRVWGWVAPAVLGLAFGVFSLVTVGLEGLLQFWVNHTTSLAGNQVWFDLIFAITIAFYLIAPRARAVGMPLLPWAIAVILTACIALLPMLARLLWLERRAGATAGQG